MIAKIITKKNEYEFDLKEAEDRVVAFMLIDELFRKKIDFKVEFKKKD